MQSINKKYWEMRWFFWDLRSALFVRSVYKNMQRMQTLYIHPNGRSSPRFKIVRLPETHDGEPHNHIEGWTRTTEGM